MVVVFYLDISLAIKLLFICTSCCRNEVHKLYMLAINLHLIVGMNDELRW